MHKRQWIANVTSRTWNVMNASMPCDGCRAHTHSIIRKNKSHLLPSLLKHTHTPFSLAHSPHTDPYSSSANANHANVLSNIVSRYCFFSRPFRICAKCVSVCELRFAVAFSNYSPTKLSVYVLLNLPPAQTFCQFFNGSLFASLCNPISAFNLRCLCHFLPSRFPSIFPPLSLAFAHFPSFSAHQFSPFALVRNVLIVNFGVTHVWRDSGLLECLLCPMDMMICNM